MTEQEMIYLYKQNYNYTIRDVLYDKYKYVLSRLSIKWMKQNFKEHYVLDLNDFISVSYLSFLKALKVFDVHQKKYSFLQALVVINHANMNHYCRTFWNLRNKIMNDMVYDNKEYGNGSYEEMIDSIHLEIQMDNMKQMLLNMGKKYLNVFELKLQGFSQKEIANKSCLTKKQVYCIAREIQERFKRSTKINFVI